MGKNHYALVLSLLAASAAVGCGGGGGSKGSASTAQQSPTVPAAVTSSSSGSVAPTSSSAAGPTVASGATYSPTAGSSSTSVAGMPPSAIPGSPSPPVTGGTTTTPPSTGGTTTTTPPSTGGTTTTTPPSTGGTTTTTPPSTGGTTTTTPPSTGGTTTTTPPSTGGSTQPGGTTSTATALGRFKAVASLNQARGLHTATTLLDGRVLVTGGYINARAGAAEPFAAENELYDPLTNTWTKASKITNNDGYMRVGSVNVKRSLHTATRLPDGRVLICGGYGAQRKSFVFFGPEVKEVLDSAHIFDPRTNKFSKTDEMKYPRYGHTATLMSDGRVLIAGGYSPGFFSMHSTLAPVEFYNPTNGKFEQPGFFVHPSLTEKRQDHAAVALDNGGAVLLIGGQHYSNQWLGLKRVIELSSTGEVYSGGQFTSVGKMVKARRLPAAVPYGTGVVVLGGDDLAKPVAEIECFDRATGKFCVKGTLKYPRTHAAAARYGTYALAIGGFGPAGQGEVQEVEAFDGSKVLQGLKLINKRNSSAVVKLNDGRVLVTGGFSGGATNLLSMDGVSTASCEVYTRS